MPKEETIVYELKGVQKYSLDGHFVDMPEGWEFVPSGDPGLTRRLKASAPDYWVVKRKFGRKEFGVGLCVPAGLTQPILAQLQAERETPEYQHQLEKSKHRREKQQEQYQEDFAAAVLQFLAFHPHWQELAEQFAKVVTEFTTPVGSGTVARTGRIPIAERARAAVIAWMRHNTTNYDHRYIPRIAGKRREVRRDLAQDSLAMLQNYRRGDAAAPDCPLQKTLGKTAAQGKVVPAPKPKLNDDSFWL